MQVDSNKVYLRFESHDFLARERFIWKILRCYVSVLCLVVPWSTQPLRNLLFECFEIFMTNLARFRLLAGVLCFAVNLSRLCNSILNLTIGFSAGRKSRKGALKRWR